ncbi:MAG: S41 family peptidase [Rhodomicrobiaceae bacterium]
MRKSDFAIWVFVVLAFVAAGTSMINATRSQSATAENSEIYRHLDLFGDVLERVRSDYVEAPDDGQLIEAAINGMLAGLDPHSTYLNPKHFRDMQVQTRGEFGGLGIEVTMEDGLVKVVSPIENTPAEKSGLLSGDLITHLDGVSIQGLTLEQAVEKMRGPVDTEINLTVLRQNTEPFDVKLVRDVIRIHPVRANMEGEDIGYLRIKTFSEQTSDELKRNIAKLKKEGGDKLKGYIVDLRNNPGGLLDQAITVSDAFLDKGAIVLTRGRNANETQRSNARVGDLADEKKIIVLINGGSASASEIVAGALQDHKRAIVVGTRSFGKGSVQTIIPLGSNGAIRLTTARYYTPSGRSIQAKGIDPDIVVEQELPDDLKQAATKVTPRGEASLRGHLKNEDGESGGSLAYVPKEKEKDTQLQYALKLLRGEVTVEQKKVEIPANNSVSAQ